MKVGQVLKFKTNQAVGHVERIKYHIFIKITDEMDAAGKYVFLFIRSTNYADCFPILEADYPEFLRYDSFISCGSVVRYSAADLRSARPEKCGEINTSDLVKLRNHLIDHEHLAGKEIKLICSALRIME